MAFADPKHEVRNVVLHHTQDAWPKLVEKVAPASLPIVEPKLLKLLEADCAQYGRFAVWTATAASTPRKYEVFRLPFP